MDWISTSLGDFAPFVYGKGLPQTQRSSGDVPVYGSNGVVGFHDNALISEPAVIIGRKGSVGAVHFSVGPSWPIDTAFYTTGSKSSDLTFIYYLLKTLPINENSDSAIPGLSRDYAHSLEVRVPPLSMQKAIAGVLGELDAKIALNSQISKTLEGIAQTIFNSWFIDFDPVKAKLAGEEPEGMDAGTAALFPRSMAESEIGLIPEGWSVNPVGDALDVAGGATPSTKNSAFWGGEFTWTTPKDLSVQDGLVTTGSARTLTREGLAKVSSGLLPVNSVVMSCRAPIGYLSINAVPTAVNQGCITLRKSENLSPMFVLNWLRANMQEVLNRAGGGTFAEISRKSFKEIPMLLPSQAISDAYSAIANPILAQLENLTRENETLVAIRDSMLPRLISGELQIPDEMLAS